MNKENLKTLAVKTESEEQSRIIVALFEAAGFDLDDYPESGYRNAPKFARPYIFYYATCDCVSYGPPTKILETLTQVTFSEFLWDYYAPEWAVCLFRMEDEEYRWGDGKRHTCRFDGRDELTGHRHDYVNSNLDWYVNPLSTRPEQPSNPQWPEPGSLPPIGVECECSPRYWDEQWLPCIVHQNVNGTLMISIADGPVQLKDARVYEFRPIQTERERFVEQAVGGYDVTDAKAFAGDLYDRLKSGELEAPKTE